jgi:hypothetical protein
VDLVVAGEFAAHSPNRVVPAMAVPDGMMALDVGPASVAAVNARLASCRTLVWNGPFGAFELAPFDAATVAVAHEVARLTEAGTLASIGGGGDTVSALRHAGVAERMTYVSAAGGAFLEWLEGKDLPGVAALGLSTVERGRHFPTIFTLFEDLSGTLPEVAGPLTVGGPRLSPCASSAPSPRIPPDASRSVQISAPWWCA